VATVGLIESAGVAPLCSQKFNRDRRKHAYVQMIKGAVVDTSFETGVDPGH